MTACGNWSITPAKRPRGEREMLVFRARNVQDRHPRELTPHDRAVLDFERAWWQLPARKNDEIRVRFAMAPSTYYRSLHTLIDRPEAVSYDPLTVRRLRRRRAQARRRRSEGRRADSGP